MNDNNTKDNQLIAEYIGMQYTNLGWYDSEEVLSGAMNEGVNTFDLLRFDIHWDWIISVYKHSADKRNEPLAYYIGWISDEYMQGSMDSIDDFNQGIVNHIKEKL